MKETLELYIPPHPNAPRFGKRTRGVSVHKYTKQAIPTKKPIGKVHNKYRKEYPDDLKTDGQLSAILQAFNKNMCQAAVENRSGVILPLRMGRLQVLLRKKKGEMSVDPNTSFKLGFEVKYSRLTNAGKYAFATLNIMTPACNLPNKEFWEFRAGREMKGHIKSVLESDRTRFFDAKDTYRPMLRKAKFFTREAAIKRDSELLKTYNEFDFS